MADMIDTDKVSGQGELPVQLACRYPAKQKFKHSASTYLHDQAKRPTALT